jgi:hypothetical protein
MLREKKACCMDEKEHIYSRQKNSSGTLIRYKNKEKRIRY